MLILTEPADWGRSLLHRALTDAVAVGFTTDLHNFAFLGKNPYLGCASDWVWFNVPHGPLKQIDSFVAALKARAAGQEEVVSQMIYICSASPSCTWKM